MRIGDVIGTVTLNRPHPSLTGATLKLAVPLSLSALAGEDVDPEETLVVYDELGAGIGSRIAIAEGPEAAMPFRPNFKPISAYNAAIIDSMQLDEKLIKRTLSGK